MAEVISARVPMSLSTRLARAALTRLRLVRQPKSWYARVTTDPAVFLLEDLPALNEILSRHQVPPLPMDRPEFLPDLPTAMRYILARAAQMPLSARRPDDLAPGSTFQALLLAEWSADPESQTQIQAAFDGVRGERMKRIQEMREDLRDVFPLGLTPDRQRADLLIWYLYHGRTSYEITAEEILWGFFELDRVPDRGLVMSYLLNPMWQRAVPHALTIFGWPTFLEYLRRAYQLQSRWFSQVVRPRDHFRPWDELTQYRQVRTLWAKPFPEDAALAGEAAQVLRWLRQERHAAPLDREWIEGLQQDLQTGLQTRPGANLIGHFRYASGLQEAILGVKECLEAVGSRTTARELPVLFECDWSDRQRYRGVELFDTTIYLAAVNTFPHEWMSRGGTYWRDGVYRVAVWYWELEDLPEAWKPKLTWMDEVWAPTTFLARTFSKAVSVPVIPMLPGIRLPKFTPRPREFFGIPQGPMLFLVTFDMGSVMPRKNPLAAIQAFRRAFGNRTDVHLVVKVSRGSVNPQAFAQLRAAMQHANCTLIDAVFKRSDTLALFQLADVYLSLHRSEGLGLGMAESMLMGKPVVATRYSGNLDFMTDETACLVDADLVPIPEGCDPYPAGSLWAEARVDHAAEYLKQLASDPQAAWALGQRAQDYARQKLDPLDYGRRMLARLQAIQSSRSSPLRVGPSPG